MHSGVFTSAAGMLGKSNSAFYFTSWYMFYQHSLCLTYWCVRTNWKENKLLIALPFHFLRCHKLWCKLLASKGFPGGAVVKNLPDNAGDSRESWVSIELQVQPFGQEDPLKKEMATHSCILAWKIPWTEEPGGLLRWHWAHSWLIWVSDKQE